MKSVDDCEYQKNLLVQEGIKVVDGYKIDLKQYLWKVKSFGDM
ncbi:MAG: hypothetical protein ACFFB6_09480 [Promethearchaeota archaeon]